MITILSTNHFIVISNTEHCRLSFIFNAKWIQIPSQYNLYIRMFSSNSNVWLLLDPILIPYWMQSLLHCPLKKELCVRMCWKTNEMWFKFSKSSYQHLLMIQRIYVIMNLSFKEPDTWQICMYLLYFYYWWRLRYLEILCR